MRPLHRPMFRYGGPIKEGVMSGIREPHAGGGRAAALVGNPVYPRTGGREHHKFNIFGWGVKPAIGTGASQATKKTVGTEAVKGIKSLGTKIKNWWQKPPSTGTKMGGVGDGPDAWKAGKGFQEMKIPPGVGTNRWYWEKGIKPAAGGIKWGAQKALPYATTGGLIFSGGMWLRPDGTPASNDEINNNVKSGSGKVPGANSDLYWQDPEKAKLAAEKLRNDRIQKYRDIMDIKGMNKKAAYDSLIAASQAINESGDFKGDIKSGKLINQIIQATSKQFDKPAQTKDAIDTLILKGEIESDIAAGKPSAIEQQINAVSKNLKVDKTTATKMVLKQPVDLRSQVIEDMSLTKTAVPTHKLIVSSTKRQYPGAEVLLTDTEVKEKYGDKMSGEEIIQSLDIFKKAADPSGIYVVGTEVIQIDSKGNTNTIFP